MSRHTEHTYSSVQARTRVLLDETMMRDMLADVGAMRSALELELWASWLLGQAWKQRLRQPLHTEVDWMLTVGSSMVTMIAGIGGARARKALTAISMLERGALGNYAGALALTLPGARTPAYLADMAQARFSRARWEVVPGDGEAILLELDRRGRPELTVALFLDDARLGTLGWIRMLGPALASERRQPEESENLWGQLPDADLADVAIRIREAIAELDASTVLGDPNEIADLRAFVLARLPDPVHVI